MKIVYLVTCKCGEKHIERGKRLRCPNGRLHEPHKPAEVIKKRRRDLSMHRTNWRW